MCDIKSAHLGNRMYDEVICTIKHPLGLRAIPSVSEETIFWTCIHFAFIHFVLDSPNSPGGRQPGRRRSGGPIAEWVKYYTFLTDLGRGAKCNIWDSVRKSN